MANYELLESLGAGTEGSVVRAHNRATGEVVALKRVERRSRLRRLTHPSLAAPFEYAEIDGQSFVVLPWADGPNLAEVLDRQGPLPMERILDVLAPVADALHYLHSRRFPLTHGDVKPANIVLTRDRGAVLVDVSPSWPGKGTRGFRAPEVTGGVEPEPPADVFSLAATIVALATGAAPRASDAAARIATQGLRRALAADPLLRPAAADLIAVVASVPTNLAARTIAAGHEGEAVKLIQALSEHRVVVTTGISGAAKSALVASVAYRVRARFPSGVWFTSIDHETRDVEQAVARALQLPAGIPPRDAVADYLGTRRALLVIDVSSRSRADIAVGLRRLLEQNPSLVVLVARRDPFEIEDEAIVPLSLPEDVSAEATAAHLADLGPALNACLERLAVFAAPFTRAAASRVAKVKRAELDALVTLGLVVSVGDRYRLLDAVASSVGEPADPDLRRRLQRWIGKEHSVPPDPRDIAEAVAVAEAALGSGDERFLAEFFDVLCERVSVTRVPDVYELALNTDARLPPNSVARQRARLFIAEVGYADEVARLRDEAAEAGDDTLYWSARSNLAFYDRGEDPATLQIQRDAVAFFRQANEPLLLARALHLLGLDLLDQDHLDESVTILNEAVTRVQSLGRPKLPAAMLDTLGAARLRSGDAEGARAAFVAAIETLVAVGDVRGAAWSSAQLAQLELDLGNRARGLTMLESAMEDLALMGDRNLCGSVMTWLGNCHAEDDPARGLLLIEAGVALATHLFPEGLRGENLAVAKRCRSAVGRAEARRISALALTLDLPTAVEVALAP